MAHRRALAVIIVIGCIAAWHAVTAAPDRLILLDAARIERVRARSLEPDVKAAIAAIEDEAKKALAIQPVSVMDKTIVPPSGDKHDYMSQAPYWWPDPAKADGRPYVRRDGERNPEINRLPDHDNLGRICSAVSTLGLAYALQKKPEYAQHAARLTRVWFLDAATRMNPHLKYGQGIPGINDGRGIGIIETRGLPDLVDGIVLISESGAWTKADEAGLQAWLRAYLDWLLTSTHGKEEAANGNNHETWYDVQAASLALYTGQRGVARKILEGARGRIDRQFEPDGRQPRELERTRSFDYSEFNLTAFFNLAVIGERVGVDLWNYSSADGRSLRRGLDFMVPFAAGEKKWDFDQITPFRGSTISNILRRGAAAWKEPTYRALAEKLGGGSTRVRLLYE
ncbi:MAG TPA: alginate lyase family protein [Vicinamibacterales bacterium]